MSGEVDIDGHRLWCVMGHAEAREFKTSDGGAIWIITDDLEDADAATTTLWRSDY